MLQIFEANAHESVNHMTCVICTGSFSSLPGSLKSYSCCSSSLIGDVEYKYLVRDEGGHAIRWKPGQNYHIRIMDSEGAPLPDRVIIADTWDASWKDVEVQACFLQTWLIL